MRTHAMCSTAGPPSPAADSCLAAITQNAELLLKVASDESCKVKHRDVLRTGLVCRRLPQGMGDSCLRLAAELSSFFLAGKNTCELIHDSNQQ